MAMHEPTVPTPRDESTSERNAINARLQLTRPKRYDGPEVRLLHEVAAGFSGDEAEVATQAADHLRAGWSPVMIARLRHSAEQHTGVDPLVSSVVELLDDSLVPAHA